LICGSKWFNTLPADLQKILVDTSIEIGQQTAKDVVAECDAAEAKMKQAGAQVYTPTAAELDVFKKAVEPVYKELGYSDLRAQIYKEIGKK